MNECPIKVACPGCGIAFSNFSPSIEFRYFSCTTKLCSVDLYSSLRTIVMIHGGTRPLNKQDNIRLG